MLSQTDKSLSLQCCTVSFVPSPVRTALRPSCLPSGPSFRRTAQPGCWAAPNTGSRPPATFPACSTTCPRKSHPSTGPLMVPQRPPSQAPTLPRRQISQRNRGGCLPTAPLLSSCRAGIQVRGENILSLRIPVCIQIKRNGGKKSWPLLLCPVRMPGSSNTPHSLALGIFYLYPCVSVVP